MTMKRRLISALPLAAVVVLVLALAGAGTASSQGYWTKVANMGTARYAHTATLLTNGKVLVAGGYSTDSNSVVATAELYDPGSNSWSPVCAMAQVRYVHTATRLADGRVLVVGGVDAVNGNTLASAEIFDPTTNCWTSAGSMSLGRRTHTATLLPDGRVLIAGGYNSPLGTTKTAEVYDPSGGWSGAPDMSIEREGHSATLLPNNKVLIAGGGYNWTGAIRSTTELYDPSFNTWSPGASMNYARWEHTATLLPNGKVLVAGGRETGDVVLSSAELYAPGGNSWAPTQSMSTNRFYHQAVLLGSGQALIAGGLDTAPLASAELFDAANELWIPAGAMNTPRFTDTDVAVALLDGRAIWPGSESASATVSLFDLYLDTDSDGCPDKSEMQTDVGTEVSGGRRNPNNPYDYFNPTNDGVNRVDDILAVVQRYFSSGDPTGPLNTIPPSPPAYHPKFNRAPGGPNVWNLTQGNGQVLLADILAAIAQYFHDCGSGIVKVAP